MFGIGLALKGKVYGPNTAELLDMLNFAGDLGNGLLYVIARVVRPRSCDRADRNRRLWNQVHRSSRSAEHYRRGRCTLPGHRKEGIVTISHFGAVLLFSLFTSIVFGITQTIGSEDDDPLRSFLLRPLRRGNDRGQLADVAD